MTKLILLILLILFQYLSRERSIQRDLKQNRGSGIQDQHDQEDQRRSSVIIVAFASAATLVDRALRRLASSPCVTSRCRWPNDSPRLVISQRGPTWAATGPRGGRRPRPPTGRSVFCGVARRGPWLAMRRNFRKSRYWGGSAWGG